MKKLELVISEETWRQTHDRLERDANHVYSIPGRIALFPVAEVAGRPGKQRRPEVALTRKLVRVAAVHEAVAAAAAPVLGDVAGAYALLVAVSSVRRARGAGAPIELEKFLDQSRLVPSTARPSSGRSGVASQTGAQVLLDFFSTLIERLSLDGTLDLRSLANKLDQVFAGIETLARTWLDRAKADISEVTLALGKRRFRGSTEVADATAREAPPTFADIVGNRELKRLLIQEGAKFVRYDPVEGGAPSSARAVPVIAVYGEPGMGKTKSIKALRGFLEKYCEHPTDPSRSKTVEELVLDQRTYKSYVGESAQFIRKIFARTRDRSKIFLLVVDDADGIFKSRTNDKTNGAEESVLHAFMQATEGPLAGRLDNLMIVLLSNLPESLDPALRERVRAEVVATGPETAEDYARLLRDELARDLKALFPGVRLTAEDWKIIGALLAARKLGEAGPTMVPGARPEDLDAIRAFRFSGRALRNLAEALAARVRPETGVNYETGELVDPNLERFLPKSEQEGLALERCREIHLGDAIEEAARYARIRRVKNDDFMPVAPTAEQIAWPELRLERLIGAANNGKAHMNGIQPGRGA